MKNENANVTDLSRETRTAEPTALSAKRANDRTVKVYHSGDVLHNRKTKFGIRFLLLLVIIFSVGVFASRMLSYRQLTEEKNRLQKQKEQYEKQIEEAQYYMNRADKGTVDYDDIIRIAREKFHLAFPDETVYHTGDQ